MRIYMSGKRPCGCGCGCGVQISKDGFLLMHKTDRQTRSIRSLNGFKEFDVAQKKSHVNLPDDEIPCFGVRMKSFVPTCVLAVPSCDEDGDERPDNCLEDRLGTIRRARAGSDTCPVSCLKYCKWYQFISWLI